MPALPSCVIEPIWDQFCALLPERVVSHPWGCHRPRIADRIVFDKLVQVLVFGVAYATIADATCSASTIRNRRDEWIAVGVFEGLEQLCLDAYDRLVGLDLEQVTVDGCITKAPCGGDAAGPSPPAPPPSSPERYRRIVKRRGKLKALVAVARSILVIVWHLLSDPAARFCDLGAGYYTSHTDKDRKARNHIRQLEALGFAVTLAPAA